jgi:hypothetical protein
MTTVGLVLYPRFTALDIVGPFQTLVDVPGLDVFFVAAEKGPVVDHTGRLILEATHSFDEVDALDVLVAALQGDEMAKVIQLAIEYDPQPPFDAGAPSKVPPEFRELVMGIFSSRNN